MIKIERDPSGKSVDGFNALYEIYKTKALLLEKDMYSDFHRNY